MKGLRALLALLACALWAAGAAAQAPEEGSAASPAVLVADEISVTRDRVLIARGNVEAFQGDTRIVARSITYDPDADRLTIEGPITLSTGSDSVIFADAAELDSDLQNGLLRSARLVLNRQLQLAAVQIDRVNGRYTQLYKTAVTSCRICDDGEPPLWQIRARRVVHDTTEQQLYFDGAQFRIRDIPIFYIPRLRLPDPTLDRATGFLIPSIRTTSQLATGLKIPYFIKLGDHRDLTLTPYLSAKTRTIELRYRQAFRRGRIEFNGALSRDSLLPDEDRGYLFGMGSFDIGREFRMDFDLELTSDDAYLTQYGYSDKDRLDSALTVSRVRRDDFFSAGLIYFTSLRAGESNLEIPSRVFDATYERRIFSERLPGEIRLRARSHGHMRRSDTDGDAGRDVARLHAEAQWLNAWTMAGGLRAEAQLGAGFDAYLTEQDSAVERSIAGTRASASLALRYPMRRTGSGGATLFLEPVVQLGYVAGSQPDIANDESTRVEFDEGNLLSLSRFPEADRREYGALAAVGLNWARYDPAGLEANLSFGQVFREETNPDFTDTAGLGGRSSDFLLAGQVKTRAGLALAGRAIFDDNFDFAKAELRGDWSNDRVTLGGSYLWLESDLGEDRPDAVSELTLEGAYRVDRHWTFSADWRYDVEDDRAVRAGLGLGYENECVAVDVSVERRYTSTTSVEPETIFGFTVELRGFATQTGTESTVRSCRNN